MDILKHYIALCWFKNHPLQLPGSLSFLKGNLMCYVLLEFLTLANMIPILDALVEVIMNTLLTLLFVAGLLSLSRTMNNYIQVSSAVFVCKIVATVWAVPVIGWVTVTHSWLSYTMLIGLISWNLAVIAYMMRKVLIIDVPASLIVALIYFLSTYGIAYSFTMLI